MGVPAAKASGVAAIEQMKKMLTQDECYGTGSIRVDGRKIQLMAWLHEHNR